MCVFREISRHAISAACALVLPLFMCGACGGGADRRQADALNDSAFRYRYISADSAAMFADAAFAASAGYDAGRMEALNNMAFAETAKMNYAGARQHLAEVLSSSSNRIELFAANVQMMRLCQRMSEN